MTKYVLNSGGWRNHPELAQQYIMEILKGLNNPKMLLCFFAVPREDWDLKFETTKQLIQSFLPSSVHIEFELAFPKTFAQQCKNSDIIYLSGGDDHLLQYWLKQFDVPTMFDGKVVATSSASSHALAKHFWTCDWRMCMDGLGILPIKFLAHYKSDYGNTDRRGPINWDNAKTELEKFGDIALPIHAMQEGRFVVLNL